MTKIMDVPEEFGDPQKEAEEWFFQESIALYEEAKRLSEEETNELKAALGNPCIGGSLQH